MTEYDVQKALSQRSGQLNKDSAASGVNGIPNSVLTDVFTGRRQATSNMMGRRADLAPSIAAKMSQAFGMDVSGVQLYRSAAMAGTEMQGMAQGNKVVLGSDVDLNTTAGQAVLGHELSHIRAQSMGIGSGSGLLSDASLERQADTEGMLAAKGMSISGESMGMSMGLGMAGMEGLAPIGTGFGASASAPMQASKGDYIPKYSYADEVTAQRNREQEADEDEEDPFDGGTEMREDNNTIPLIWERKIPGDPDQQPKAIIGISQGGSGFSNAEQNGHSMMGLEYTRRDEGLDQGKRYRVDFGFYPKFATGSIGDAKIFGQGATIPGQLMDERNFRCDISRKYPISYSQAETVVSNARDYEEGGYNLFSRNCTTFVADMTKEAGINVGGIFQDEDWLLEEKNKTGLNMAKFAGRFLSTTDDSKYLNERMNRKDGRLGVNKNLVTQEEANRFRKGRVKGGLPAKGYGPSRSADRMRASQLGESTGKIANSMEGVLEALSTDDMSSVLSTLYDRQREYAPNEAGSAAYNALVDMLHAMNQELRGQQVFTAYGDNTKSVSVQDVEAYRRVVDKWRKDLDTWMKQYGDGQEIMRGAAAYAYGVLEAADEAVFNSYPAQWAGDDQESDPYSELLNNPSLIRGEATDRTFENEANGQKFKKIYLGLNKMRSRGALDAKARAVLRGMTRFSTNIGAHETKINSHLQKLMRARDNIAQKDLNADFGGMEPETSESGEIPELSMEGRPAKFRYDLQKAEMNALFGDQHIGHTGIEDKEWVKACHSGLKMLVGNCAEQVEMIATAIAGGMPPDKLNAHALSAAVIRKIELLYCIPQIRKRATNQGNQEAYRERYRTLDGQYKLYADKDRNDDLYKQIDQGNADQYLDAGTRRTLLEMCQRVIAARK